MDIWRYSDWWGLGPDVRNSQKHIWHWRDWIVDSLNTNVGYDEMVRQMLAADELYPDDPDKLRATGFLVRHYFKFNRNTWMEETIEHTSKGFLGLTMNCARCHDHKYDPWTQEDYFQFRAFFEPYHVRTDQVPGELDYEKDGIPRAYDAHLDAPTYLFTQGDENRPVKERVLSPSLPVLLSSGVAVEPIQTIALPTESHQTGLRTWVVENHRRAARLKREASQQAYESARQQVDRWLRASHAGSRSILFEDDFGSLRDDRWLAASGHWEIVDREVRQIGTSSAHSSLASKTPLAGDFEWSGRLTIHGGQRWKSAGVAFDVTDQGRIGVYLSAFADGAKVQIYFRQNGVDQYSDAGSQARSVPLDRPSVLTIRVRGSLVHVLVDGAHALSYRVPMERTPGTWELFTYDAQASFDDVRVMSLPADMDLPEPGIAPQAVSLEDALLAREIAVAFGEAATKEEIALEARLQAMRLSSDDAARKRAGNAQWEASLADAEHQYLSARRSAGTAAGETARTLLETRLKRIDELRAQQHHPDKPFTPVPGSSKAPESNQESPASLAEPFPAQSSGRRSALARWMTHPQNATFGRVAVNHLWARHLGQALVKTVIDFGLKGASPTHPELLDYLTTEWTDRTFDMKALHRDIVTSHTYRLSSSTNGAHPPAMERDPNNETYWRRPDLRMEAEILRDSLLTLGHRLDRQMHVSNIDPAKTPSSLRRSLYFTHSHNERDRFLEVFDSASTRECYVRSASIIPQQSLALANSRLALESSQEIAAALTAHEPDQTDARFIDLAWLWILSARPTPDERRLCEEAMTTWRQTNTAESARTQLVRSLINHNDFIAIR
jgi:hypothetical protein